MRIKSLSHSSANNYEICPWKYFLVYQLGFEDVGGPASVLGNIAHTVLEILSRASMLKHDPNSKVWNINWLMEKTYNHYMRKKPEIVSSIQSDKLKKVSKGIADLLNSEYTPIRDNTIGIEFRFGIQLKEPKFSIKRKEDGELQYLQLNGFIDRIDKIDDKTIEIIDYKTGKRETWGSTEKKKKDAGDLFLDMQPRLYHLAAKEKFPWAENIIVTFIYMVDGGAISVPFTDEDIETTKDMISRKFRAIQANEDPQRIYGNWMCRFCTFYKDETCQSVWDEKNEFGSEYVLNKYTVLNYKVKKGR